MAITTMQLFLASLHLLGSLLHALAPCTVTSSEFHLQGDYLIGGLFEIHQASPPVYHDRPVAIDCSSKPFILSGYRKLQLMRFSVDEINNSTNLLPNVSLGYEILDHCSDAQSFPGIFSLISVNGSIQPWAEPQDVLSKVIAVVGTFTSTETQTVAPLFMADNIPMVKLPVRPIVYWDFFHINQVSYGATSSIFSRKQNFPSFLRTVHPNQDIIKVIVHILQHFKWRWVAFLNIDDDYGNDGRDLFIKSIKDTDICLAYTKGLYPDTDYSPIFKQIEAQRIPIIIVFVPEVIADPLIESAIDLNVTNKVWIAVDAWSLNKKLPKVEGIKNIGTVIGVAEQLVAIPGFSDFIYASISQSYCKKQAQQMSGNQNCNCSAKDIINEDPSFSFPVYSSIYAIAHALHNTLECGAGRCKKNKAYPHMVLAALKKSNFTLLNQHIQFDENGDPKFGSYSIVFWNNSGDAEEVGFCKFGPSLHFYINASKILWYTKRKVPTSQCSQECKAGYSKQYDGIHKCCFKCEICPNGTYVNTTEDPYKCIHCKETEWSPEGSSSCSLRVVEYIPFTDTWAILILVGACTLIVLIIAMSVLFAFNYNTPVVRSAGGPMCFLILGCLSLCSLSVFFYFDKPTSSFCVLRLSPFLLFYTVCLACFFVRSFQIVFVFKLTAKFAKLYSLWMRYHGQWLVITVAFVTQALLLVISYSDAPPKPHNETVWYRDKIILDCDSNLKESSGSVMLLLLLCLLCFIFSYMGKDLPKNYNEAKAITFCLLLLILTWIIFSTVYVLYHGKYIQILSALAVLSSLYPFLLFYFLPKCYIIIFQSHKNTQQYFQGLIQNYSIALHQ